jgi:hypothetical protein
MLAAATWNTIARAQKRRIQLGEDAISTYNLLILDAAPISSVIVEDTRVDEATKGADWEFWIGSHGSGWTRYAVQAKKIDVSKRRYPKLDHRVRGVQQVDILENYARANGAAPIYCFYNYVDSTTQWNCCSSSQDIPQLGCTITPSPVVRAALAKRGGKTFKHIHSQADTLPWRCLVMCPKLIQTTQPNPLATAGVNSVYEQLPPALRALQRIRNIDALSDAIGVFSKDSNLRPRWIGVIELEG